MPLNSAGQAFWFMNANCFTAFGALPFLLLAPYERPDPLGLDHIQVVDHAHAIFGSVALVQMFQPGARKAIATSGAIFDFALTKLFAISYGTSGSVF
jgi:hypothetical protein